MVQSSLTIPRRPRARRRSRERRLAALALLGAGAAIDRAARAGAFSLVGGRGPSWDGAAGCWRRLRRRLVGSPEPDTCSHPRARKLLRARLSPRASVGASADRAFRRREGAVPGGPRSTWFDPSTTAPFAGTAADPEPARAWTVDASGPRYRPGSGGRGAARAVADYPSTRHRPLRPGKTCEIFRARLRLPAAAADRGFTSGPVRGSGGAFIGHGTARHGASASAPP